MNNILIENKLVNADDYYNKYLALVTNKSIETVIKGKTQKHHIVPVCVYKKLELEVDNSSTNLVNLYYRDHILAHYYLLKCSCEPWFKVANMFAVQYILSLSLEENSEWIEDMLPDLQEEYEKSRSLVVNPMDNEEIKEKHDSVMRSEEVRNKISNTMKLKHKDGVLFSEEHKKKISESCKCKKYLHKGDIIIKVYPQEIETYLKQGYELGSGKKLSPEHKQALINSHKGKKASPELRKKLSDAHKGKSPGNKGVPLSEEHKKKLSESITGSKWMNNGVFQKMIHANDIEEYLKQGFIFGKLQKEREVMLVE